ncbi:Calx-beta domain-containing protein, partial [Roseivirga sp.]|uniref:Calx-beta domain-containing protein n=1 Tax=Roseivirga sp. TaxID=1964215 RepID=UPI003B8B3A7B
APTLTTVTLSTNNSTDNQHGTTGDVVTLSFTSTDVLSANPTVGMSIGGTGVTATVNDLGSNNYSATYTLLGTENEGAVTFTIDFVDDAGISGTQVTTTTDASSVEADFNAPTLSTVTLITDNGTDNQRAKDGNTVLLDLASSDVLSALPTVAIKSGGTDVQGPITVAHDNPGAPDFQNFNVTYAVDGVGSTPGTDKDADGAVTFTVDFVDDAGISGTQVTATTNASTVTVDASAPTVTGVSSSTADGSFIAGNVIAVTVTFSESVTVTGTPQLTLETGTTDRTVNYTSGSPGTTLTFNYTVQAGDVSADLDYETNNSLALNSGTITDGAGNAATLTLPSPAAPNSLGANKALVIDTSNPTISSTSPLDNATDVGITGDITITFNEDIAFGTGNITLVDITGAGTNTIVIDAAIPGSQASISGAVLTINPTANLELNNNYSVQIAATAIDDTAGNSFAGITDNTTLNFTTINTSVAFSSTTSSAAESTSSANLAVSLNSASGATVTVNYAVVGTATGGGTDYTLADGTLTFNPGDVTKNITIASIIDDALDENDETVIVTLSNPTNAGLGTNTQHTYTINDNDATPTVSFNTTASNGAESVSSADLQVDLSAVSGRNVTVNYTITGTATGSGTDFTLANGALVISAGDANNNITIGSIVEDALDEVDETVIVSLSSPVNATLGSNTQHIYTINDNDATPTVAFTSATSSGAESTSSANLQVALSAVSGQNASVDYTVTGTASGSGTDYTLNSGTLNFTAGDATEDITIASIIGDALDEDDETVIVILSNPVNLTLGTTTQHTYTILDDDTSPTIAFTSTTSSAAESVSSANLQVALSSVSGRDVTVSYTVTGTATGLGTDYTLADGTLTITASNSSNNITIAGIIEDVLDEVDETVIVTLSSPTNATLGTNTQHTYTITDNDAEPTVAFALATDAQTEDQPSQDVQVSLSAVSGKTVTVNYAVTGTATAGGTDHTTTGGTITFNPGDQNFQQQIVGIVDDLLDEENETIILTLSSPSNATLGGQTTHTYTITDNDAEPTVSLSVDNSSIDEASGTATLTATLSAVSGKNVDVTIGYSGTAINGTDYNSNASTTITINAGSPSATAPVIITPVNDGDPEAAETIILDITAVTNGTEDGTQQQTITITDDDTPDLTFTAASSNGAESVSSAGITVDLSLASGLTVTADYALTGTATEGTDYTLAAGTLTFNPGDVQKTITIAGIVDDAILESNETVIVTLSNLSNANAGTNQVHTYTINDNDAAAVTIADITGAENGGDITVTATLDNAVQGGFTVDVSTADGTAEAGDDYTAITSQTLTFSGTAGEMQTFTITPTADTKLEADETLTVSQGNFGATSLSIDISDGATVTINNDDNAAVTIEDVSGAENGGDLTFTATLDVGVQGGFTVDVNTSDNTATTADSDYTALTSQTLTFTGTAGETQQFTVTPSADTKVEADETIDIIMNNLQATSLSVAITDMAVGTLTNDDAATLAIDNVTMNEGASGTTTYTFTATLTGTIDESFTVDYVTADGTATTADGDYSAASGTLNFSGGTSGETQTFSVSVVGDAKVELDENFTVTLSNVQANGKNLTIATATGTGTITNDDAATLAIDDVTKAENADGGATTDFVFTVTLDAAVDAAFTVNYATADGTATAAGSDYTANSGTVNFAGTAGETQTITVTVANDDLVEADEDFTVDLSNLQVSGRSVTLADATGTGTITNDDVVTITIGDMSGNEDGGAITLTATLDKAVDQAFDVTVASADATATAGSDYTAVSQTLSFAGTAGETKTFTVIPTADQILEADEVLDVGIFSTTLDNNVRDRNIDDQATVTITNDD